jgi:hypothetical protein
MQTHAENCDNQQKRETSFASRMIYSGPLGDVRQWKGPFGVAHVPDGSLINSLSPAADLRAVIMATRVAVVALRGKNGVFPFI